MFDEVLYCGDLPESRIDPLIKNFSCVRKKEFLRSPAFDPLKDAFVWMGYGLLPYPLEFNKLQKSNITDSGIKQSRQLKHPPRLPRYPNGSTSDWVALSVSSTTFL